MENCGKDFISNKRRNQPFYQSQHINYYHGKFQNQNVTKCIQTTNQNYVQKKNLLKNYNKEELNKINAQSGIQPIKIKLSILNKKVKHMFQIDSILTNPQSSLFASTHNAIRYMLLYLISQIFIREIQKNMELIQKSKLKTNYEGYQKKIQKFKNKSFKKLCDYEKSLEMVENQKMVVSKAKSTMDFITLLQNNSNAIQTKNIIKELIEFIKKHLFNRRGLKYKELQMKYAINSQKKLQGLQISQSEFEKQQIISFLDQAIQFNFFIKLIQFTIGDEDDMYIEEQNKQIKQDILLKIEKILSYQPLNENEKQNSQNRLKENIKLSEQIQKLNYKWTKERKLHKNGAGAQHKQQQQMNLSTQMDNFYGLQIFSKLKKTIEESLSHPKYITNDVWLEIININQKKQF